jgi:hypothetical protein
LGLREKKSLITIYYCNKTVAKVSKYKFRDKLNILSRATFLIHSRFNMAHLSTHFFTTFFHDETTKSTLWVKNKTKTVRKKYLNPE